MYRRGLIVGLIAAGLTLLAATLALVGVVSAAQGDGLAQDDEFVVHLPVATQARNEGVPGKTQTVPPTPPSGPNDPYLLIQQWDFEVYGPGCRPVHGDGMWYEFDRATGELRIWCVCPRLTPRDVGYVGCGTTWLGQRSGDVGTLHSFQATPFTPEHCEIHLQSVAISGEVIASFGEHDIELGPGGGWSTTTVREDANHSGCIITTTHRITNLGWQDRAKIEYP